ncbi:MAG: helix-turn-helix domain-containing protein [Candidatus Thiodiazotropha lotti]|nr:helix-turn-helix domain-containing protein [Candidatus Thiodiazotropha lotti]MCW4195568.1 helix-turn-helix domain-containing protein [Candidatus Thiodiazotropha lotti]
MQLQNTTTDLYHQINTEEAAKFLGITTRKLEQMRQHGTGPVFVKVSPKCVRYRIKELVAFQEANLKQSTIQQ